MTANKSIIILIAASIIAAVFLAGCASPTPTVAPTVTPAPTVPPTISPVPTPATGSEAAAIVFTYNALQYTSTYENIPVNPGEILFGFNVKVDSDKPVSTDPGWFSIEYRQNGTSELKTYKPMTVQDYPKTIIGNGSKPATGRVLIVLPAPGPGSYGPVPVYYKKPEEQSGPYKVLNPVYGSLT